MKNRTLMPHERAADIAERETKIAEWEFYRNEYQTATCLQMMYPMMHIPTPIFDYFRTWLDIYDKVLKELIWEAE